MIFRNIHISGFGKYNHEDISFSEGVNVIYGENGSGKTTLHAFLKAMLFGADPREEARYAPWETQSVYGGSLELETEEGRFQIDRCMDPARRSVTVRSASTGETVGTSQEDVDRLLSGLTEAGYRNTISIEQLKAAADGALSEALKKRVAGLSLSGATSLDVSATINSLKEKKQELSAAIDQDAADRFQEIFQEICQIEDRLKDLGDKPDQLEKEAGELTEALEAEEAKVRELDALYKEKTAALDAHTMSKIRDTDIYQERLHDAFDAHRLASRETELHEKRSLRIRDVVSGFLAFVIFLLLGLGTLFYEQLPFTGTPFPLPQLPFVILFLAASGISFLVTLILLIRSRRDDSDSEAMAAETEQFLKNQFETHLGSGEVTEENKEALAEKLRDYLALKKEAEETSEALNASRKDTEKLRQILAKAREDLELCSRETWEFEQAMSRLSELEDQKTQLGLALRKNERLEEQIKAVELSAAAISKLSERIREAFSPALNRRVSEILCAVTDGVYDRVSINEDLSVTLRRNGQAIPLEALSRGTIEQVYLALRLSAAELLYPGKALPVLLDDTFAYYDDARLHNTLRWLAENHKGQVFLFTCHKREAAFLSRLGVQYHLVPLS